MIFMFQKSMKLLIDCRKFEGGIILDELKKTPLYEKHKELRLRWES